MATNLDINPDLLNEALAIGGEKSKKNTVATALKEYIARRKQVKIISVFGTFEFDPTYNYKQQRKKK